MACCIRAKTPVSRRRPRSLNTQSSLKPRVQGCHEAGENGPADEDMAEMAGIFRGVELSKGWQGWAMNRLLRDEGEDDHVRHEQGKEKKGLEEKVGQEAGRVRPKEPVGAEHRGGTKTDTEQRPENEG